MLRRVSLLAFASSLLVISACSGSSSSGGAGSAGTRGTGGVAGAGGPAGTGGGGAAAVDDTDPPSLTIDSEATSPYQTYIIQGTATDNVEVTELSVRANDGEPTPMVAPDGRFGGFIRLADGPNTVVVVARDAAGNEAQESITVSFVPDPGAPSPPVVGGPSSIGLIDAALDNGDIDEETALLYRVYAIYRDERLPEALRDETGLIDATPILFEVVDRLDSLSPDIRALVEPFLIPPIYEGSAWGEEVSSIAEKGPPLDCAASSAWTSISNQNIRVWWHTLRPQDARVAGAVLSALDNPIWQKLTTLAGRTPLKDAAHGVTYDGCSDHFDVYISSSYKGWAKVNRHQGANNCEPWPAFMTVNPSGSHIDELSFAAAHEFMHAVQLAYQSCLYPTGIKWWTESSAQWAVDHVYPLAIDLTEAPKHFEHVYAESYYLPTIDQSLYAGGALRWYGAYLWPFYLSKTWGANMIPDIWGAIGTATTLADVLAAMEGELPTGFYGEFPEFMLRVWNQKPIEDFKNWEMDQSLTSNPSKAEGAVEVSAHLDGQLDRQIILSLDFSAPGIEPLAAKMIHIKFDDPDVRSILFSNGFTFDLEEGSPPDLPTIDKTNYAKKLSEEERKGRHVYGIAKRGGQWVEEFFDLTEVAFASFCQDYKVEAIEELVLIFTNARYKDTQPTQSKGLSPRLFVSNMGCGDWTGQASVKVVVANAPAKIKNTNMAMNNLVFSRPKGSAEDALRGASQIDLLGTIIPASNFGAIPLFGGYALDRAEVPWSTSWTTNSGDNRCDAAGMGTFDESDAVAQVFGVSPYLTGTLGEDASLYRSYQIQLGFGTTTSVVSGSCSQTGPFSEAFGEALAGGFRGTQLGEFLISRDGTLMDKKWSPDSETTWEIYLQSDPE